MSNDDSDDEDVCLLLSILFLHTLNSHLVLMMMLMTRMSLLLPSFSVRGVFLSRESQDDLTGPDNEGCNDSLKMKDYKSRSKYPIIIGSL